MFIKPKPMFIALMLVALTFGCTRQNTVTLVGGEETPALSFNSTDPRIIMYPENISQIKIECLQCSNTELPDLSLITGKNDITAIAEWAGNLSLKDVRFSENDDPDRTNGGLSYSFDLPDIGDHLFSYRTHSKGWIIRIADTDNWYLVENPSDPPLETFYQF